VQNGRGYTFGTERQLRAAEEYYQKVLTINALRNAALRSCLNIAHTSLEELLQITAVEELHCKVRDTIQSIEARLAEGVAKSTVAPTSVTVEVL